MNPHSLESKKRQGVFSGPIVVLGYGVLTVVWSAVLLVTQWPDQLLLLLSIPVVWSALYYPRRVYVSLNIIAVLASIVVTSQLSSNWRSSLLTIGISAASVLVMLELLHTLIAAHRQTEESLEQSYLELAAVNVVATTITSTLEIDEVLRRLTDTVGVLFPHAFAATIQMLDEQSGTLCTEAASSGAKAFPHQVIFGPGEGIAGLALLERRAINVADVLTDPRYLPGVVRPPYRALLVAPLTVGPRVLGTLSLEGKEIGAFQPRDEYLVEALAQHAAIAIENAKLYDETRRRLAETTVLQTISKTATNLDFDQVMCQTVNTVHRLLGVDRVTVLIPDEPAGLMRRHPAASLGFDAAPTEIPMDRSISGEVYRTGQTIRLQDVSTAPNYFNGAPDTCSELCVPLRSGDRVIGVLNVESPRPAAFDEADERLFEAIAAQLAVALENARLYQEMARRAREQEVVARVMHALNASLDVESAFPAVVEGLRELVDSERVSLALADPERHRFSFVALDSPRIELSQGVTLPRSASAAIPDLEAGRVHLTPDLATECDYPAEQALYEAGFRSRVNLPLGAGKEIIGALNLASRRHSAFAPKDLPPLKQIADALAIAIVNSRLFDRVRSAESQYRGLFEGSADPIALLSLDGTLLDANPAACRVLGQSRQEVIGQAVQAIHPQGATQIPDWLPRAAAGETFHFEFSPVIEGQIHHFEASVERIYLADGPIIQWTAHDVTARRELDHWREEFTDIIVHNLRNPLTWIQSGVGMAQILLPEAADPDVNKALDTASKGIARVEQQIDVLLNIGRAETGQELTDRQLLTITDLIQDVAELFAPRADAKSIRLEVEQPSTLPPVWGNRNMLAWTLQNLLDNAIKFSPTNETIRIRATATPDQLLFCVSDRGPGIPPQDRERIFRKFIQAQPLQNAEGTGLGLYFCKLAVQAHNGEIWVQDNPDSKGSTFCIALPLHNNNSATPDQDRGNR